MTKLVALQTDLTKAQEALAALQGELPQFHALLTENEQDVQRLKTERASLDAQAPARGRVGVAKEMLEQHQADIRSARAEVERLEAATRREELLLKMAAEAEAAKQHRAGMDRALDSVYRAVYKASETLLKEWRAERAARRRFAEVGAQLSPGFNYTWGRDDNSPQYQAARALLHELDSRDVPLDAATDDATGHTSCLDTPKRELPRDELSMAFWAAFKLIAGDELRGEDNLQHWIPTRADPMLLLPSGGDSPYSL